jgi:AraC-like DNA-binding protein
LPRGLLAAIRAAGVDVDGIASALGIADLSVPTPLLVALELFERVVVEVRDPALGLTAGAVFRPELFGVAGLAAMAAPTFGDGLTRLARYKGMLTPDRLTLVHHHAERATSVEVMMEPADTASSRMRADGELAFLLAFGRNLTEVAIVPRRVAIRGPAPSYRERYEATFGCPVAFDRDVDAITFATSDLHLPLVSRSRELSDLFSEHAEQRRAESGSDDVVVRARGALLRALRGDVPSVAQVARTLGQSERSLQRRLAEAGVSFAELLDDVRRELALDHLARTEIDVGELSFLLGFSTPSSLYRAFKRWERTTPRAFRRAARGPHARG